MHRSGRANDQASCCGRPLSSGCRRASQRLRQILVRLNRELPRRQVVLSRLVMVYEQLRDGDKAEAYRRVLSKVEAEGTQGYTGLGRQLSGRRER